MSSSSLTSSRVGYSYHPSGDSSYVFYGWGAIYVGRQVDTGNSVGYNSGIFEMKLYNMPNRKKIAKIKSISVKITSQESDEGYNGCTVKVEYLGKNHEAIHEEWRLGSETVEVKEKATATFKTTDVSTCSKLKNLIVNSTSGESFYFRIRRTSGMGIYTKAQVELIIEFDESNIHYFHEGQWRQCVPYYYTNGQWKQCITYYHKDSVWKQT